MPKAIPFLKALLAGCIGFLAIIVVLNLAFGKLDGAAQMMMPLLFGLYAFVFIGRVNWTGVKCPSCATQQPFLRWPSTFRQLMWGGWNCTACGTDMDRTGKAIDKKA